MAGKDRTAYKSQVNTDLASASEITAAEVRAHLQEQLADNVVFSQEPQKKRDFIFWDVQK